MGGSMQGLMTMPRIINNANFEEKLTRLDRNISETETFLEKGTSPYFVDGVNVPDNYLLVKANSARPNNNGGEIESIRMIHQDPETGTRTIVYAVNLNIDSNSTIKDQYCSQILVWRSTSVRHRNATSEIPSAMFFHFIEKYVVIISDTEQTNAGRRFWELRINDALDQNKFVYFTDFNDLDDDLNHTFDRIFDENEFNTKWMDHGWGESEEYKDRLFLISSKDFADY
jgi:hypothetical protein